MDRLSLIPSCTCCLSGYHLPLWVGLDGIFAAHGLQVDVAESPGRLQSLLSVAGGEDDCCLASVRNFLEARHAHPDLPVRYVFMVSRRSHLAAFTLAGAGPWRARSPRDFAGLDGASFLRYRDSLYMGAPEYPPLLDLLGLSPGKEVEVAYAELYEALAAGRGEVAVTWLNLLPDVRAAVEDRGGRLAVYPFHAAGLEVYGSGVVAGPALIENRPGVLGRLMAALREALEAVRRDPRGGLGVFRRRYPDRDPDRAVAVWEAGRPLIFTGGDGPHALGSMDAATWRRTIEHHARSYGTRSLPPEEAFVPAPAGRVAGR